MQIEQRGNAIDGEAYNIDPTLELVAGELQKRIKVVHQQSQNESLVNVQSLQQ
jgi:hypothetical protein